METVKWMRKRGKKTYRYDGFSGERREHMAGFSELVKVGGEKETEKGEKQGKTHVPPLGYGRVTRGKWVSRVTVEGYGEDVSLFAGKKFLRPPTAAWPRVGPVEANSSSIVRKYWIIGSHKGDSCEVFNGF